MFDRESRSTEQKEPTDYSGLVVGVILLPVLILFINQGKAEMGLAVFIASGATVIAIKSRWRLRKHPWFWAIIGCMAALQTASVFFFRAPQGNSSTIGLTMLLGFADFVIILGAIELGERFFSRSSIADDEKK